MKVTLFTALFAAVAASTTLAADVNVMGARTTTAAMPAAAMPSDASVNVMGAQTSPMMTTAGTDIRIASKDILNRATALLNKNTLATDNNVFIARSNLVFTQNDRLAMRNKVEDVMKRAQEQDMTAATLTKDVLRAVSAPDTDSALMTKASGVVAAKGDPSALAARIAAFVDAVGQREMEQEQAIQSQTPRGIIVLIGTKDLLRQPTAVINKNMAASDNQVTVSRSAITPTQNDQVVLTGGAKVADAVLPAAAINVGQVTKTESEEPMYRTMIAYPKEGDADAALKDKEQWLGGFGGLGWGRGYRYPLGYWNTFGAGLYGGGCGLGFGAGGFYYC
jgi:dihydrofolate reductase